MKLSIIAACSNGGVIGKNGELPWHLPADLERFKKITSGHAVVMGRKTAESIQGQLGGPLPDRANYVLTSNPDFKMSGFIPAKSLPDVVATIEMTGERELFFIGGEKVFGAVLHFVDRLYMTFIDADIVGDAVFPEIVWEDWRSVEHEVRQPDAQNPYKMYFAIFDRELKNAKP